MPSRSPSTAWTDLANYPLQQTTPFIQWFYTTPLNFAVSQMKWHNNASLLSLLSYSTYSAAGSRPIAFYLSVCLCVRERVSAHFQTSPNSLYTLPAGMTRSSCGGVAIGYVFPQFCVKLPCTCLYFKFTSRNFTYVRVHIGLLTFDSRLLKVIVFANSSIILTTVVQNIPRACKVA